MPSTFLDLVADLHRESGAAGSPPTTVDNLRGEQLRMLDWVRMADIEIQNQHLDWSFLWAQGTLLITSASSIYAGQDDARIYDHETFVIEDAAGTKTELTFQNYLDVRREIFETEKAQPHRVFHLPDGRLQFDQPPDASYTIHFDYYRKPVELTTGVQEPLIPEHYRYGTIVGKALEYYANYEDAAEARLRSQLLMGFWMPKLEAEQLPGDRYLHSLAEGGDHVIEVV